MPYTPGKANYNVKKYASHLWLVVVCCRPGLVGHSVPKVQGHFWPSPPWPYLRAWSGRIGHLYMSMAVSHLEGCVLHWLHPLLMRIRSVLNLELNETAFVGLAEKETGSITWFANTLEHRSLSHYLNEGKLFLNLESNKKKNMLYLFILLSVWGAAAYVQQTSVREKRRRILRTKFIHFTGGNLS